MKKTILDFSEATSAQEDDLLYLVHGIDLDRDKKITKQNLLKERVAKAESKSGNVINSTDNKVLDEKSIVNDVATGGALVPLSAEQGKQLKILHIDNATAIGNNDTDISNLQTAVGNNDTDISNLQNQVNNLNTDNSPIGSIIAIHPDTKPAYKPVSSKWKLCDGNGSLPTTYFNNNRPVPKLNDDRFLMGGTSYSGEQGNNLKVLSISNMPTHAHGVGTFQTGNQSHNHNHTISAYFNKNGLNSNQNYHAHAMNISGGSTIGSYWPHQNKYHVTQTQNTNGGKASWQSANQIVTASAGNNNQSHNHVISGSSGNTGSGNAFDIKPKYFKVLYYIRIA